MKDIKEITKRLEEGVKETLNSDKFQDYLTFMGKFYNYSFGNTVLIWIQRPDATHVAGYKAWSTKFKRQVRKGEKGITIMAPIPRKFKTEKQNAVTGELEEVEVSYTAFKATTVFDISQTDGDEIPTICDELTGCVDNFADMVDKLQAAAPVPVSFEDMDTDAYGCYKLYEKRIIVQSGLSQLQTVKTLIHEIAHSILHAKDTGPEKDADHFTREVQAESVAYTVCSMLGLDTSGYSFEYVAGWSKGKEVKELMESMEVIRRTAKEIYEGVTAA